MLKNGMGLWIGWCLLAAPMAFADTGSADDDTASSEDTGSAEASGDDGASSDTGTSTDTADDSSASTNSNATYGAAQLADDSGGCTSVQASPAMWMFACAGLLAFRRRIG